MTAWLVIIVGGLLTFAMRLSFIQLLAHVDVPDAVRRALRLVPAAVLSALVMPALLMPAGQLDVSLDNHRWLAGLIAIFVAWRTRSMLLTILAGMLAIVLLQLLL
jgi:branched-subunit amino acid transport protein